MATTETWVLDGVALTSGNFDILELNSDPPKARPNWLTAADSEYAALMRQPLHENRVITMKLRVAAQASMNAALDQVGAIRDKCALASDTPDGIALVWTPANSTRSVTFDVLAGDIPEMPIGLADHAWSWFKQRPIFTIELTCKPYWRGTEVLTSTASGSTPVVTIDVANVPGDVPALGRLIVTDTATQSRRDVEWGIENTGTGLGLVLDSDSLVTSGFAGTQTTRTGSYDPGAAGNNIIRVASVLTVPLAICGTGNQTHIGTFRVWARMFHASPTVMVRFVWRNGSGPYTKNPWTFLPTRGSAFTEVDLGVIRLPTLTSGTQVWDGWVEVYETTDDGPTAIDLDYIALMPTTDGYGRADARYSYIAGRVVAWDEFTGATAGVALNARVAPLGGTWATSGVATDLVAADNVPVSGLEVMQRSTTGAEASPRWAVLGATNYTDTEVQVGRSIDKIGSDDKLWGPIARWVDSSNYLYARRIAAAPTAQNFAIIKVVAGVSTGIAVTEYPHPTATLVWETVRIVVYATGRVEAFLLDNSSSVVATLSGYDSALATGGTLATGKPGFLDWSNGAGVVTRWYDRFYASTPTAEPISLYSGRSLQFRHDGVIRQDSAGTTYGRPSSYRGGRFMVPTGTSRVAVKARRVDLSSMPADNVTDATQLQVGYTPRGLVVPR